MKWASRKSDLHGSEWTIPEAALPSRRFRLSRFGFRFEFFRYTDQNSVRSGQYQNLLDVVVGQRDHSTSTLQKSAGFEIPAARLFQEVSKTMPTGGQFLHTAQGLRAQPIGIFLFRL